MSRRNWLLFAAMCVIWGIPYLLIRVAVRDVPPADLVFARTGIAALILLPIAWRRGALRPAFMLLGTAAAVHPGGARRALVTALPG